MRVSLLRFAVFLTVFSVTGPMGMAQSGVSSGSVSRGRAMLQTEGRASYEGRPSYDMRQVFIAPDDICVEEYVNYHKHQLPPPKSGESVAVDLRWGNARISNAQSEAVLQVGLATAFLDERIDFRPLNLSFVIDKSGSMSADDKLTKVKEALCKMLDNLRPDDLVSIVVFDSKASVLREASRLADGKEVKRLIRSIVPGSATNLHEGLMLGYKEAEKHFQKRSTNRVILLTDGITNQGVVDAKRITEESSEYNAQGIDLSTIGVGMSLDKDLLRTLSKQGRGLYHFVADATDISKVFDKEVQSLVSPVAREVTLSIVLDPGLKMESIFGYEPEVTGNQIQIPLDNMNNGLTQVVMLKVRLDGSGPAREAMFAKATLSFFDIRENKRVEVNQSIEIKPSDKDVLEMLEDSSVKKNFTIAELAQSLQDMSSLAKDSKLKKAEKVLDTALTITRDRYPNMDDADIRFVFEIVEGYHRNIKLERSDKTRQTSQKSSGKK